MTSQVLVKVAHAHRRGDGKDSNRDGEVVDISIRSRICVTNSDVGDAVELWCHAFDGSKCGLVGGSSGGHKSLELGFGQAGYDGGEIARNLVRVHCNEGRGEYGAEDGSRCRDYG